METLRANPAAQSVKCSSAHQLLSMPEEQERILAGDASDAALLYNADFALPPQQRELARLVESHLEG